MNLHFHSHGLSQPIFTHTNTCPSIMNEAHSLQSPAQIIISISEITGLGFRHFTPDKEMSLWNERGEGVRKRSGKNKGKDGEIRLCYLADLYFMKKGQDGWMDGFTSSSKVVNKIIQCEALFYFLWFWWWWRFFWHNILV